MSHTVKLPHREGIASNGMRGKYSNKLGNSHFKWAGLRRSMGSFKDGGTNKYPKSATWNRRIISGPNIGKAWGDKPMTTRQKSEFTINK